MEKIKFNFILVLISTFLLCCINQNKKKVINEIKHRLEKNTHISNIKQYECKEKSLSLNYLNGKWNYVYNNNIQDFAIDLKFKDNRIFGSYCFVYGEFGNKIDCPEGNSINAYIYNNQIKGKVISVWADDSINIELKLVSKDTLSLLPKGDTGDSFFQRQMFFIK